jgi:hypothetical protein
LLRSHYFLISSKLVSPARKAAGSNSQASVTPVTVCRGNRPIEWKSARKIDRQA